MSWYDENARDLPWRNTRDPWRVLISEVMLQQIQVTRAIPFYESFLARFPTPRALAYAPLAEAIRVWGDLGRYRRVVNLHRRRASSSKSTPGRLGGALWVADPLEASSHRLLSFRASMIEVVNPACSPVK